MDMDREAKKIRFASFRHSMLCKVVACLLTLIFTFENATYGYEQRPKYESRSNLRTVRDIESLCPARMAAISGFQTIVADGIEPAENLLRLSQAPAIRFPSGKYLVWEETRRERDTFSEAKENALELSEVLRALISEGKWPHEVFKPITSTPAAVVDSKRVDEISPAAPAANETEKQQAVAPDTVTSSDEGERPQLKEDGTSKKGEPKPDEFDLGRPGDDIAWREAEAAQKAAKDEISFVGKIFKVISCYFEEHKLAMVFATATLKAMGCVTVGLVAQLTGSLQLIFWVYFADLLWAFLVFMPLLGTYKIRGGNVFTVYREAYVTWKRLNGLHKLCLVVFSTVALVASCGFYYVLPHVTPSMMLVLVQLNLLTGLPLTYKLLNEKSGWKRKGAGITVLASSILLMIFTEWLVNPAFFSNLSWIGWGALVGALWGIPGVLIRKIFKDAQTEDGDGRLLYGEDTERVLSFLPMVIIGFNYLTTAGLLFIIIKCSGISLLTFNGMSIFNPFIASAIGIAAFFFVTVWFFSWKLSRMVKYDLSKIGPGVSSTSMIATLMSALSGGSPFASPYSLIAPVGVIAGSYIAASGGNADDREESAELIPGSPMPNIPEIVREALTNNPGISFGTLIEEVKKDLPVPLGSTMEDVYPDLESRVIECLDEDDIGVSPTGPSPKGSAAYCFKSLGSAPKTISELANYSGRAESTIRETIRTLIKLNLVRKMGNKYGLNNRIPGLKNPKAQDEIYKYLSRLPHRWRIYAFQRPYIKGRITKIIKKYSEIEKGIKKLKQRLIKRFYLDDKKEIAQINKIIDQWVDAYGADSVLELGGLDLKLLKVLIFERKVRNLLHKFGMRTFLRIARLKVKDAEEVMSNVAVFTSPKSSRQLLFYVRAFAKINSYLGNYLMARREKHVPIFRHIIAKHGIGVLVRLVETVGYKVFYFFEYRLDGYDTVRNEEMMEFLDRIKDSKKDVLDLIRILEFIKEPYSGRKIRDSLIFVTNAFMDNLLHLLKGSRPGEVLKFLKAMGSKEAGIFLSRMHDYLKGLIEEHGIEPITEIARAAGKDGAGWHRAIYENLRVVVDEFGFQILPTIAKKAKGSTEAMFRGGVHLAMRYIERDKKDRREKFLRYALALAGEVRKVDNSKAGVILSDHAGIFEKMVVRKGKNPAELEVELSEWARFLVKMTVGADEYREGIYLLKISLVLPLIERFGKEPFLKIARTYPGKAGDILNGIYILSEFIKTKEDISYYAEKVDKIEGGVSKPGAIDALGHVLPLIRKFGIDRVIEISRVVKGYTRAVFKEILPAIMDLIEDEEDFDKLIVVLKALKRDLKKRLYTVFISGIPQISCFLKSIEDLEDYRPALVKIVRVSNDNAIYVIIRSIGLFEERIHSKEDLLNHILPVARIAEYSRDYADTIFDEHLPYMIGVEPDAVHKICALIDNKIPEDSAPDVSSRYAQSIVLSIAVLSSLGINGFGMVEYLLKKKRSFALSELAEYIYITPRYLNGHLKDTAGFINSLPDSNAKFELTRMVLKRIEMFRCRDREPEATSSETKKFFKGLNTVARLEGDEILMNLLKLNLDKMNGAIDELPLKKRDLERLKRFIRTGGLRKAYKGIIEAALNDKPDFKKIWSLIEAYNRKVKALIDSIKRRPEVKVLYEKIDDLNREMGNLRRDIQTAKRGGHIRKAGKLGKNLEKVLGELRQLYKAAKGIDKIRNLLSVPFQSLINKQRTETNLEEYKEDLRKIMTDAKIQIIRMFMIRIRNRIYEAILGKPIFKEIEGSYMLDRVASICYGMMLSGEVTGRRLADLLKLYIEGETPDKIRRYVYTEDVKKKLEEAGYNPSPFIEGCSMKYDASTASDFILRKEERLRNHIIELQGHIRGLGLDVKELDISQDPQSIYKMLIEQLREKQVDLAALESMLNDIKIHLDAIKSIQAETQKKGEAEQVEFYISLDPVEEMYMGVGFASCLDIEREVAESPLGVGLSWDKLVAYVKNEKGNRIARRLLVITDKGIVVFNQHFNTQLDLDYGWVKFLQKLADETGKDVIVPRREKVSSSFKKVLDRSGIETVRNLRCKILQREYASYLYDDLGIRKDYTLVIGSGYRITPKPVKKEKKPVLPKKAEQKESYRFLTDPIYRAALANSMSSLIVKAHDLGIKTVLACGISAQPACQFFRLCWERIYPDEEPPRIEFIGEAAGQVSEERYDKEGVISKISSFGKLEAPILILDDIYATGMTMGLTKKLLADHFEDREVYTAALFRLGEIVVDKPDLPAPEIKENVYKLGSNWYLTRLHTLRPKGTLTYKVSKKKLKQIFEEDLPHDLELLSHKVYERVMRQTKPPAAEQDEEESDGPQILPGSPMPNIPEIVREALTNNPGISFGT
ncbi:MAG: hypothetical protein HQ575_06445, partial [Candidatus Omnitrophica bacterium]|nr:hypothetical protein [Candidatus Omnitrophota bacterium]